MYNLLDMGSIMIREIMMSLDKRTLSTLQENEVRKAYFVSTEKLNSFLKVKIQTKNFKFKQNNCDNFNRTSILIHMEPTPGLITMQ